MHRLHSFLTARTQVNFGEMLLTTMALAVLFVSYDQLTTLWYVFTYVQSKAPLVSYLFPLLLWPVPLSLYVVYHALIVRRKSACSKRILFFFGLVSSGAACLSGLWVVSMYPLWHMLFPLVNVLYFLGFLRLWHMGYVNEQVVADEDTSVSTTALVVAVSLVIYVVMWWTGASPFLIYSVLISAVPLLTEVLLTVRRLLVPTSV